MPGDDQVQQAIDALRQGKIILIYDADGREEETDLVIASKFISPDNIRILRKDGGGLICTTMDDNTRRRLGLPYLSEIFHQMGSKYQVLQKLIPNDIPYDEISSFSVTINHRKTFTGITDCDRALTISEFTKLVEETNRTENGFAQKLFGERFRAPGHVHLLNSSKNILESRKGHTELSTAMMIMSGLPPTATICEMMGDDCKARDKESAKRYAEENGLIFLEGFQVIEAWKRWRERSE